MDGMAPPETTDDHDVARVGIDDWDSLPPAIRPRRKLPKWPFFLAGLLMVIGVALAAAWPINVPYYAISPGPVNDVTGYIDVPDPAVETGDLFFLTVTFKEVNLLEYLAALSDREVSLEPRERIRPVGVSQEELRLQNLSLMEQSKRNAVFVALTELGYDVTFEGMGALVSSLIDDSAADGLLEVNDVIVAVNDDPVEFSTDAVELVGGFTPGEMITLTINRPTDGDDPERLEIPITLGPHVSQDEAGNVIVDESRGMVGVVLTSAPANIVFPVDVEIDSQNIGGPSAGMMFTLEIMNQLSEDDLTKGHRIAGTGTIAQEGEVGAIGGIRQKVFGAIRAGAEYVLVPAANFPEASDAAGDDIEVVSIATIDDALDFLASLPAA
jgi:PDZ domain-containing protein